MRSRGRVESPSAWAASQVARNFEIRSVRYSVPIAASLRWCSIVIPAAETSTRRSTRGGNLIATSQPMKPPIELPTSATGPVPSASHSESTQRP